MKNKTLLLNLLIHGFAIAHALVAWLLFGTRIGDSAILTILTIAMILFIVRLYEFPLDIALIFAMLCCFAGFYLGTSGAGLLKLYLPSCSTYAPEITTFFVTEFFGWITFLIVYYYGRSHRKALNVEIVKKQKARLQYHQLKQQLNPHFLFNSLNVLDYLVHTDANRASDFIKKLAGVYRYMLNRESDMLVALKDELIFSFAYIDLLKERFDKGLLVTVDIPEQDKDKRIIPCGLQLLIENATKHNVVSPDMPLHIQVSINDDFLQVQNNLQPRLHTHESTGVGLNYIKNQYASAFNKEISVVKISDTFTVKIPLI